MCRVTRKRALALAALSVAVFVLAGSTMAETISQIEAMASGTTGITLDGDPVITAILSQPGTVNGRTYTSWSFLVQDGTGSMDIFGAMPTGSTYTPTVGDVISASGEYYPYHQIPELEYLTAISATSSGNSVSAPLSETISDITSAVTANSGNVPLNLAGYMIALNDVTVSGITGTSGTGSTNQTGIITDSTGSMTLYHWPSSYSVASANFGGAPIPTTPVNMTGFVSEYTVGTPEFTPITVAAVSAPEPGTLALTAMGLLSLVLVAWRRRRTD